MSNFMYKSILPSKYQYIMYELFGYACAHQVHMNETRNTAVG